MTDRPESRTCDLHTVEIRCGNLAVIERMADAIEREEADGKSTFCGVLYSAVRWKPFQPPGDQSDAVVTLTLLFRR